MPPRNNTLRVVHTRPVINVLSSGNLTISNSAYSAEDYLHTNPIIYSDSFLEQSDTFTKVIGVRVREHITTGTLQKPALRIYFFANTDIVPTANDAFDWADGTSTLNDVMGALVVGTADYVTVNSAGNAYDAIANVYFSTPLYIVGTTNRFIKAIAVTTGTPTFGATTTFQIDLIVEHA